MAELFHVEKFRIGFNDVDWGRITFFGQYFSYFNKVMEDGLIARGLSLKHLITDRQFGMPVIAAHCDYRASATYEDIVRVEARIGDLSPKGITFTFEVFREGDEKLLTTGYTNHRFVSTRPYKGIDAPQDIYDKFLENWKGGESQ